ncbi:3-methyl-2-oxobutanoate hydroxymethyltransferase [Hoeflea sp. G2-23]|uniref:3-methyl-2-oxobutanoate hydroxymethyltransferase n=1 Tax=Hoeflea algicola TaxID=2983763 RepID=A0ABT3Z5I5_9HYPH|nr:3-methyl-2-oxobutanoate hydroxymethyltransferase [Hoeflea algicola]MCY0146913.1 3-methyl-2-oxobutanoate hydroxymethyltransferase [Hoeflea algicola]
MSVHTTSKKITSQHIRARKGGEPIVGLTAYTASMAKAMDAIVDFILVGDSLAMTIYGEDSTVGVDLDTMIRHGRAVVRATSHACVVVDLPFGDYQASPEQAFMSAARILRETGCDAVKLEGGIEMAETVAFLSARGVPVMGHIGLTPQSINTMGGFKTQGKDEVAVQELIAAAKSMENAGCFALVVEGVVESASEKINQVMSIPTIGIGASVDCDGQILVVDDVIGLFEDFKPKFVKRYAQVMPTIREAIETFAAEVRTRQFPSADHVFGRPKG